MSGFRIDDVVTFGRPNGEQTLGQIVKINRKTLLVQTLEGRGRGGRTKVGAKWRVAPSLCQLEERGGKAVTDALRAEVGATYSIRSPYSKDADNLVAKALDKLTSDETKALANYFRRGYIDTSTF